LLFGRYIYLYTIVKIRTQAMAIREDQQNPAILWVALEDPATEETSLPHHRKPASIGMMILAEEKEMIPIDSGEHFSFLAEVHGANGSFLEEAPVQLKQQLKLHLYLRLVAVHEEVSGREVDPLLDVLAGFAPDSRDGPGADPL
jgi:hypothetical protein